MSTSGYFEHGRRKKFPKPSKPGAHKRMSDEALLAHMRAIHAEVKGEYGWPKMWKELVARGHRVGKERVRRLMQLHGIRARCERKFVVTTDSKHHLPIAPDLVQRNFTPTAPNQVWTGDITYIATDEALFLVPCKPHLASFLSLCGNNQELVARRGGFPAFYDDSRGKA